jgi:adenylosuccinate lyase
MYFLTTRQKCLKQMGKIEEIQLVELFASRNRLQIWMDIEAVIARCQAKLVMIPEKAAADIEAKSDISNIDLDEYERLYKETKHPLIPLLKLYEKAVGKSGEYLHYGATTHDIVDIGKMLMMKRVWQETVSVLSDIEASIFFLVDKYIDAVMAGRSHNIQAVPITFGFKAAIWADEIHRSIERLREAEKRIFVVTFSGASGTMASFDGKGHDLEKMIAKEFDLGVPAISWHSARDRFAEMAGIFAIIGGTLSRIAQEVYLLMGTETGELIEGLGAGVVGSSAMPHKINPVNSQHIMGDAKTLRYAAAQMIEDMHIDHEHNLVHFDDERTTIERIGNTMVDILFRSKEMIDTLYVDEKRMRKNLDSLHGVLLSENVMMDLAAYLGKMTAKGIITEIATKAVRTNLKFKELLNADERVSAHLTPERIDELLDPRQYARFASNEARRYLVMMNQSLQKLPRHLTNEGGSNAAKN